MNDVLQKVIASRSPYSRRQAEKLIRQGLVMLSGKIAKLGDRASDEDKIVVCGRELTKIPPKVYIMLNKPAGYTCTNRTFKGEENVFVLVQHPEKLFVVGRLDKDSHGLVLLTNDGDLTQKLAHPRYEVSKEYEVTIDQDIDLSSRLLSGVDIGEDDGIARASQVIYLGHRKYRLILSQGKKRQIKRMFRVLGANVLDLKRVRLSNLNLGTLPLGQWRYLEAGEIKKLAR